MPFLTKNWLSPIPSSVSPKFRHYQPMKWSSFYLLLQWQLKSKVHTNIIKVTETLLLPWNIISSLIVLSQILSDLSPIRTDLIKLIAPSTRYRFLNSYLCDPVIQFRPVRRCWILHTLNMDIGPMLQIKGNKIMQTLYYVRNLQYFQHILWAKLILITHLSLLRSGSTFS